jgi:hypothetical protein
MVTGWRRKRRASVTIGSGMVAENEHRLPVLGQHLQDLLDVVEEAEVEHAVGLVEHERPHPVQAKVRLLLPLGRLGQVEQAARSPTMISTPRFRASTWGS